MDLKLATQILQEAKRRQEVKSIDLLADSFPEQTNFVQDFKKYKAALTTRRAGKTTSIAIMLAHFCGQNENVITHYIGLTKESAKNVLMPIMKQLNRRFKLNLKFLKSPASVIFPNGSVILFFGINDTEAEREKLLGQKSKLTVIDECASMTIDLKATIQEFIAPTLIDDNGQLVLIGTPGNNRNYFCDITEDRVPGWSVHKWSALQNPHVAANFQAEIDKLIAEYPDIYDDPGFQQHYLGKWTIDYNAKCYKANQKNYIPSLPPGNYHYFLDMDIGWEDDTAFVIQGFSDTDKTLYFVESYSAPHMTTEDIIDQVKIYQDKYNIEKYIIDSANKQYVEELKRRTNIPFSPASKTEKMNYVAMMNSDFIKQKIKIVEPDCQSLIKEYDILTTKRKPNGTLAIVGEDHNADAALYGWRAAYNYLSNNVITPVLTIDEQADLWEQEEAERHQNSMDSDWFDDIS